MSNIHRQSALLRLMRRTPLHPQWIAFRLVERSRKQANSLLQGRIVNIGSGYDLGWLDLPNTSEYITLDYPPTGADMYKASPNIWADAQCLPLADDCVDTVLLLEVAEHLPRPGNAFSESSRILKPGGRLLVSTPFIYPEHDLPHDYHRWTRHGLETALTDYGLHVEKLITLGNPPQTASMMLCIALAQTLLEWFDNRSPLLVLGPILMLLIPLINISGELLGRTVAPSGFMAKGLFAVAEKQCRG